MSKYFSFCKNSANKTVTRKKRKATSFNPGYIARAFFILCVLGLVGSYVVVANSSTTTGFEISRLENTIAELSLQNETLQNQVSSLQSLERVQSKAKSLNLVAVGNIEYLKSSSPVALAR